LNCVNGLAYDEIAATLSCSVGTVKSRLFRARAHMQRLLLGTYENMHIPAAATRAPGPLSIHA